MKKLAVIIGILLFCTQAVFANEVMGAQCANDNRATVTVQKQPANAQQKQEVKQNKWCIIILVNGKVKETGDK